MTTQPIPFCTGCNKPVAEIEEYIIAAEDAQMEVNEYVRQEEGTYNHANAHVLCTECYVEAGCPSSAFGWVAP